MRHRILQPALAAGVALSLALSGAAFADTVKADADSVTVGTQGSRDLGVVAPGAVVDVPLSFELTCWGLQHVDVGQTLAVGLGEGSEVSGIDETALTMEPALLGPVPEGWAPDGEGCSEREPSIVGFGTLRLVAPATLGPLEFTVLFAAATTTEGSNDAGAVTGTTAGTFTLTVAEATNTPPVLVLPADLTVVADLADGWTADYTVAATDAEDEPDPTPVCVPAAGAVLPLGTTMVTCSVTDSGGLTAEGSFSVTVTPKPDEAAPLPTVAAAFDPPVKAGALTGQAGRTIPLKVRLAAGGEAVDEGSLVVAVAPCAGDAAVAEVAMDWRAASGRWFGLLRTKGLEAGCYAVRALHDGIDVGGFELTLVDRRADVAKEKGGAAKEKAAAGKEKGDAAKEKAAPKPKPAEKPAEGRGAGRGKGG